MAGSGLVLVLVSRDVPQDVPLLPGMVGCLEMRDGVYAWAVIPESRRLLSLIPPSLFDGPDVDRVYRPRYELVSLEGVGDGMEPLVSMSFPGHGVHVGVADGLPAGVVEAGLDVMRVLVSGARAGSNGGGHMPMA